VFYEIIYGSLSYPGKTPFQVAMLHHRGDRPGFRGPKLDPGVEPAIRELICQCWHQSPEARPTFQMIFERLEALHFKLFNDVNVHILQSYVTSILAFEQENKANQ